MYDYNFTDEKRETTAAPTEPVPKKAAVSELPDAYPRADYIRHLSIRCDSDRFFMLQDKEKGGVHLSRYVHEVLSSLQLPAAEAHPLGQQLLVEGLSLSEAEKAAVLERLERLMKNKQIRAWFEPGYEVLIERELLYEGKLLKPDRVMQNESEIVVVNFHSESKEEERHKQILKRQLAALSEGIPLGKAPGYAGAAVGGKNLKGFLVYLDSPVPLGPVPLGVEIKEVKA